MRASISVLLARLPEIRRSPRSGVTLIEMLISVALTLMLVFAMVQVFGLLGDSVTNSRAMIEMSGQLRSVANRLQADLDGLTVETRPPVDPAKNQGYLELLEGPARDSDINLDGVADAIQPGLNNQNGLQTSDPGSYLAATPYGDIDDVLAFTSRSDDAPFVGRLSDPGIRFQNPLSGAPMPGLTPRTFDSTLAEVVWWTQSDRPSLGGVDQLSALDINRQIELSVDTTSLPRYADGQPIRSLHRRALLIRPDVDLTNVALDAGNLERDLAVFFNNNDISARVEWVDDRPRLVANSLADLSQRTNRFAHKSLDRASGYPVTFLNATVFGPGRIADATTQNSLGGTLFSPGHYLLYREALKNLYVGGVDYMRRGEDVMLADVLAFDLRVFDPKAVVLQVDGIAVSPSDSGYVSNPQNSALAARGAYVDLGYNQNAPAGVASLFSGAPDPRSHLGLQKELAYCTWTDHYERDGFDQPGPTGVADGRTDWATDGLDNNHQNGVDDLRERETMPPYPVPLRGLRIQLRMMEYNTRQVRQITVIGDFAKS